MSMYVSEDFMDLDAHDNNIIIAKYVYLAVSYIKCNKRVALKGW